MVIHRPFGDTLSARASLELAHRAETIDEYRELDMLAHAWEGGSLSHPVASSATDAVPDADDAGSEEATAGPARV